MNNFQRLEAKNMEETHEVKHRVKQRVDKSMDMYRFVGNIFDLYIPKIVGFMSVMLGGEQKAPPKSKYPNQ